MTNTRSTQETEQMTTHVHGPHCSHGHDHDNTPFVRSEPKIGANDPCHCGSGKKFKKCCRK